MSKAAKSIFLFGIYMELVAISFIFIPNIALGILGMLPAQDVWIRCAGLLLGIFGYYYINAAQNELTPFFQSTVYGRAMLLAGMIIFVLLGMIEWPILLVTTFDCSCGIWTAFALKADRKAAASERNFESVPG